jgi:hypothetical protein
VDGLNPAQQRVIELLGKGGARPAIADGVADDLRAELDDGLVEAAALIPSAQTLWVSKHHLATIHQCEAHHLAGEGEFEWSPATARGIVAHRAIELMLSWRGAPVPGELVDEALERLASDPQSPLGPYLSTLSEFDRADLRNQAVNHVTRFQDCFPPIKAAWVPRVESRVRVELFDGRIRLTGKVDLTLGRPQDRVIIDLKTGSAQPSHREDLRFYALLETLSLGVPPRKVASYYLDSATAQAEDVTEGALWAATRRVVDGVERMVAIRWGGDEPRRTSGTACRWCPLAEDCAPGQAYLAERAEHDGW